MQAFINSPNLPSGQVKIVAVGEDYARELGTALLPFGIVTLSCPKNPLVDSRLGSHIDLSVLHLGGAGFLMSDAVWHSDFARELKQMGADILISELGLSSEYPKDAALCALSFNDRLYHNLKYSAANQLGSHGFKLIHVNQGYAKCAVCLVSENAAISADAGLVKAMRQEGMDVLQIAPKGIFLNGFAEGFLGGAAFKIAPDKLAFTGRFFGHPNEVEIEAFLKLHGVSPIYLTEKPIFDIGSVIPIIEETL